MRACLYALGLRDVCVQLNVVYMGMRVCTCMCAVVYVVCVSGRWRGAVAFFWLSSFQTVRFSEPERQLLAFDES